MPAFGETNFAAGAVLVGATGVYDANTGDVVLASPGAAVVLPTVVGLLPGVASQSNYDPAGGATGASGAYPQFPVGKVNANTAPNADNLVVIVSNVGVTGTVAVTTADGTKINGITGATGVAVPETQAYTFTSFEGNWYTV
jgi:hypothetical protein